MADIVGFVGKPMRYNNVTMWAKSSNVGLQVDVRLGWELATRSSKFYDIDMQVPLWPQLKCEGTTGMDASAAHDTSNNSCKVDRRLL